MDRQSSTTAGVLTAALGGLTRIWRDLTIPALIGSLPAGVASFFIFRTTGAGALAGIVIETPAGFRNLPDEVRSQILTDFATGAALALTLQFLGALFILIAAHLIVADDERGMSDARQRLPKPRLLRAAAAAYPRTLVAATIASLGSLATIGLGLALWSIPLRSVGTPSSAATGIALVSLLVLLIPGLWLVASVSMTTPIAVIVGDGAIVSIQRSAALVRGRVTGTMAYLLVVGSLGLLAALLIQVVAIPLAATRPDWLRLVMTFGGVVISGMLMAAIGVAITYWYLSLAPSHHQHRG